MYFHHKQREKININILLYYTRHKFIFANLFTLSKPEIIFPCTSSNINDMQEHIK
jgi:hypothetical protein